MSIALPADQLRKLDDVNKRLYVKSLGHKMSKQSSQLGLQEMYKPLLLGQKEQTSAITETSQKGTEKIVTSITEVLNGLAAQNVISINSANRIIKQLKESNKESSTVLDGIFKQISKKPEAIALLKNS